MAVFSTVPLQRVTSELRFDAEYFQPDFLEQEAEIRSVGFSPLSDVASVSDGNHLAISHRFSDAGVRYLRGQDLTDYFIADDNPIYIPIDDYEKLARSHIFPGDVLLSIVGTVGNVAVVSDKYPLLTASCKLAIIRAHSINSYFLAAYLASNTGQDQLRRRVRGAVQQGLILPDLRMLPIPVAPDDRQTEAERLIRRAFRERQNALQLFGDAGSYLDRELQLNDIDLSDRPHYTASSTEVNAAARMDPEYFNPKYLRVREALSRLPGAGVAPLEELVEEITNGHTPLDHDLSIGNVVFLTAEHISDFDIDFSSGKRILTEHHESILQRTRLRSGDLLVTIKGRVGNAAVADEIPWLSNINQDVAVMRLRNNVHPYYVAGFLNSAAGRALVEQTSTGQINPFLGIGNLRQIPIPMLQEERMDELGDAIQSMVFDARRANALSIKLLEEAKTGVDLLVRGEG